MKLGLNIDKFGRMAMFVSHYLNTRTKYHPIFFLQNISATYALQEMIENDGTNSAHLDTDMQF